MDSLHQFIIMKRFFFALDIDEAIDGITIAAACFQCSALKKVPHFATQQSLSDPPETIGSVLLFLLHYCPYH